MPRDSFLFSWEENVESVAVDRLVGAFLKMRLAVENFTLLDGKSSMVTGRFAFRLDASSATAHSQARDLAGLLDARLRPAVESSEVLSIDRESIQLVSRQVGDDPGTCFDFWITVTLSKRS